MVYPIHNGRMTVGRSPECAIQIIDKRTSRVHAEFSCDDEKVTIRDLGSKNGTLINDVQITGDQTVYNGDKILIGETIFVFESDPGEKNPAQSTSVRLVTEKIWGLEKGSLGAGVPVHMPETPVSPIEVDDPTERLKILLQVSDAVRTAHEVKPLLETVMDLLFTFLQPDRAFIMLLDAKTQELSSHVTRFRNTSIPEEITVSKTIVDKALKDKLSLLVSDALSDVRFKRSESIVIQKIRSAIVAPFIFQDEIMGVLYFDTKSRASAYGNEELELATGIANQTAIALSNISMQRKMIEQRTFEREMEIAREIQCRLLPRKMPEIPGYDFAAINAPAKQVGGDYYDFLSLSEDELGIAIADVSGKGVPAAILIASVRSALQAEGRAGIQSVVSLLEHLNELVYRDTASDMFVTMVFSILHPSSGLFQYANAGHPYPLLFTHDGEYVELEIGGCFLGIGEKMQYGCGTAILAPGGTLILYSDGVTDTQSPNGDLYGRKRLIEVAQKNLDGTAENLLKAIVADTKKYQGDAEQFDDFTLVVVRRN